MPGYKLKRSAVSDTEIFDKYQCPNCCLLLKNAVQPAVCGHWLCKSCADTIIASSSPKCPRPDCQENLQTDTDEDSEYFPDRFVRREIEGLIVSCPHRQEGCMWEDRLGSLEGHLKTCEFISKECPDCGLMLTLSDQMEAHQMLCSKAHEKCPFMSFGCSTSKLMTRNNLKKHIQADHGVEFQKLSEVLRLLSAGKSAALIGNSSLTSGYYPDYCGYSHCYSSIEGMPVHFELIGIQTPQPETSPHCKKRGNDKSIVGQGIHSSVPGGGDIYDTKADDATTLQLIALKRDKVKLKAENEKSRAEIRQQQVDIQNLKTRLDILERNGPQVDPGKSGVLGNSLNADDPIKIWKISQFRQKMSDAQTGKCTSMPSLPFYTGRYGYKMCLRLYILGDGIGKNSHMSLFFVIMKGEFDNILQWPFTHKVTFKLINQTGGRDIIDTFQPDPMSSSFHKPKSDMNIASGCPRFVSHTELKSGGFIVDDTVFIKYFVDVERNQPIKAGAASIP